jgi:hypothetical protein
VRLRRHPRRPQRFLINVTWFPGGASSVDLEFLRRDPDGHGGFVQTVIGRDTLIPSTMGATRQVALLWLEQNAGADLDRDSYEWHNWHAGSRDRVQAQLARSGPRSRPVG